MHCGVQWRFCRRWRRGSLLGCILSWRFYVSAVQAERSLQFVSDAMDTWNIFVGFSALFTRRDEERLERTTRELKRENERARMREQEGRRQSAAMAAYRHERLIGVSAWHLGSLSGLGGSGGITANEGSFVSPQILTEGDENRRAVDAAEWDGWVGGFPARSKHRSCGATAVTSISERQKSLSMQDMLSPRGPRTGCIVEGEVMSSSLGVMADTRLPGADQRSNHAGASITKIASEIERGSGGGTNTQKASGRDDVELALSSLQGALHVLSRPEPGQQEDEIERDGFGVRRPRSSGGQAKALEHSRRCFKGWRAAFEQHERALQTTRNMHRHIARQAAMMTCGPWFAGVIAVEKKQTSHARESRLPQKPSGIMRTRAADDVNDDMTEGNDLRDTTDVKAQGTAHKSLPYALQDWCVSARKRMHVSPIADTALRNHLTLRTRTRINLCAQVGAMFSERVRSRSP